MTCDAIREPCGCEWGDSCDLHAELGELEEWHADGGMLSATDIARMAALSEWSLWLERMEADA